MKRNKTTNRAVRHASRTKGRSGYGAKSRSGQQMYGPGCCAHRITHEQVLAATDRARAAGHFRTPVFPRRAEAYEDFPGRY